MNSENSEHGKPVPLDCALADHVLTVEQFKQEMRRRIGSGTQKEFALAHGVSNSFVNDILNNHRLPSHKIAAAMGYRVLTVYEKVS